jgi:hypothetical protein
MAVTIDLRDWRRILAPCPVLPEPVVSYVFHVNKPSELKARIIEVLSKYGMPYVAFPDENNIVTCRMRFILDHNDNTVTFILDLDRIQIDFLQNQVLESTIKKATTIINFAVALLRETGLVNNENETKVRESMIRSWNSWIEVPKALLPIFLSKLMSH